ncbi:flavodoxin [Levilactobacillus tujiorum]|uniref:Flavodoxin n=1 Tax=Levilactobacillus tujiorum TaxID=2912243 RepID=A0ABX1L6R0_9LACO|nr:flavodoxin [Levilactobacillus tujiorum]MCH5465725.1 flavodoxin [Levilactobacillus tujiorum]NLR12913.1 flavodoxin [Lactobacillus sp. HBUAS51387]NLR30748.1 flavodoxin [Levilactobacillus tujiorum]
MPTAHVVFATITGNNEDVADIVTEKLEELGCQVKETEISQTDAAEFQQADICVVCAYTYDEGSLPDEGLDFYDDLQALDLHGKIFGVTGSGDTFYGDFYNTTVDHFEQAFKLTGATQGAASVKINLEPDQAAIDQLDAFASQLVVQAS